MKTRMKVAASPGAASGMAILRSTPKRLSPSTSAASSMSRGMSRKKPIIIQITSGSSTKAWIEAEPEPGVDQLVAEDLPVVEDEEGNDGDDRRKHADGQHREEQVVVEVAGQAEARQPVGGERADDDGERRRDDGDDRGS